MTTMPSRQRGLSLIGWAVVILVVVVLGTAAFRMVPAYMEYSTISTAINSVLNDSRTAMMSPSEIRTSIDKRFTINQVDAIKSDDLVISREGSMLTIATDYEVREPLFYNVSVVMDFKHEFKKDIRQ